MTKKGSSYDWSGIIKIGLIGGIAYIVLNKLMPGDPTGGAIGGLFQGARLPPSTLPGQVGLPPVPEDFWQQGGYAQETVSKEGLPWWSWLSPFTMLAGGYQWATDPGTRETTIGMQDQQPPPQQPPPQQRQKPIGAGDLLGLGATMVGGPVGWMIGQTVKQLTPTAPTPRVPTQPNIPMAIQPVQDPVTSERLREVMPPLLRVI